MYKVKLKKIKIGFTPLEKAADFNWWSLPFKADPVKNKLSNGVRKQSSLTGFTLLELLIVLVIMGFLLAMVVPRLANIGNKGVGTIDETNIRDLKSYVVSFKQQYDRLPDKLITLVNSNNVGGYQLPEIDDLDTDNGPETISWDFFNHNKLFLHILNYNEAKELIKIGIRHVAVLNDREGSDNQDFVSGDAGRVMNIVDVEEGVGVLMVGAGASSRTGSLDTSEVNLDREYCNPEWIYRIVLGIGPDCELISKGMVQDAPFSPAGIQSSDYYTYNYYCLVLPRLDTTVNRLKRGNPAAITVEDVSNPLGGQQRTIDIDRAQEDWDVDIVSPQGRKWSTGSVDVWRIDNIDRTRR